MRKPILLLAITAIALLVSTPAPAGEDREIQKIERWLDALNGAISAQLRLVEVYADLGRKDAEEMARARLRELAAELEEVARRVERLAGPAREPGIALPPDVPGEDGTEDSDIPFRPGAAKPPAGLSKEVAAALEWLARHQHPGGYWDADAFSSHIEGEETDGPGEAVYDIGVTGLAVLAFLGAGESHLQGNFVERQTLTRALKYLKGVQDPEGCFGPRSFAHFTYTHAIATLAMCEAYAMTKSPLFKGSAQAGVDFILKARNPYLAWRYGVRPQDNDTSVTGWMVAALAGARAAGLRTDPAAFTGALAWVEKVTEPEFGRVGYVSRGSGPARLQDAMDKFPTDLSEALTAEGILIRIHCGEDPGKSEMIRKGTDLIQRLPPRWEGGHIDMMYWFWGTLAMFQVGGDAWRTWNQAIAKEILPRQAKDGSFDPVGAWGKVGGRVYSTALMTLVAEVHFRYEGVFRKR